MDVRLLALSQFDCSDEADNLFGPIVYLCRRGFDFTLLFEQSILFLLPASLFLVATPIRLAILSRTRIKASRGTLGLCKGIVAVALVAIWLSLIVAYVVGSNGTIRTSIPSSVIGFISSIAILLLSHFEHERSVRPSSLLNIYLCFSVLFDIVQLRSLRVSESGLVVTGLFATNVGLKLGLLLLEAWSKGSYLAEEYADLPSETTAGVFNRRFFWWLNRTLRQGSKTILTIDVLQPIDQSLDSKIWAAKLHQSWIKYSSVRYKRWSLVTATLWAFRWPLATMVFPRVCLIGLNFAQPFLISRLLDLLGEPDDRMNRNTGYLLIGAAGLIYFGIAILNGWYKYHLYRCITMFRGAMVIVVFNKALELPDNIYNELAPVSLMGTDTDRICVGIERIHEVWAQLLEVTIGVALLGLQLGWACIIPVIIVGGSTVLNSYVARFMPGKQKIWAAAVQKRIAVTTSAIHAIKAIRMTGLSQVVADTLLQQRTRELDLMRGFRWMSLWLNSVANIPTAFCATVTFTTYAIYAYVENRDKLDVSQAFTSLALINLVAVPAGRFLSAFPVLFASLGCFDRIQDFLLLPERVDPRFLLSNMRNAIEIEQVKLTIKDRPADTSSCTSLKIQRGCLTTITGPVGVGKTTLARALLGEVPYEEGHIRVCTNSIGFCAQNPWLLNSSIQQNICGLRETDAVDEEWYKSVLYACDLDKDIDQLPERDLTVIGSRGVKLSGGQRHRVALARLIYARAEVMVLDDIFSVLDSATAHTITDRLLGASGILRRMGIATILISHSARHFMLSDNIVLLGPRAVVEHQGPYDQMKDHLGYHMTNSPHVSSQAEDIRSFKPCVQTPESSKNRTQEKPRFEAELSTYRYYAGFIGWQKSLIYVTFQAAHIACVAFPQVWLMWWTTAGNDALPLYLPIYVAFSFLQLFNQGVAIWSVLVWIAASTASQLHWVLLKTVMQAKQAFFTATDVGITINRFSQDMTLVEQALPQAAMMTVGMFFMLCGQLAMVALGSTYVAISLPPLFVVVYWVQMFYLRTSRQLRVLELEAKSPIYSHYLETLDGLSTIRALSLKEKCKDSITSRLDTAQRPYYLLFCIQRWLNLVFDLIVAALAVLVIALAVSLRGSTSAGRLGISLNNVLGTSTVLSFFINAWTQLETSLGAIVRIKNFESDVVPEARPGEIYEPPISWPQEGLVEINCIKASYDEESLVLDNINMRLDPGQKIGICGRTGSGKSSLLSSVMRLLDLQSGSILIDGVDISSIPRPVIRDSLIAIPQEAFMLNGSIRFNLDPGSTQNDEYIIEVLRKMQLWSLIQGRGGLDYDVDANSLSQGQQQLLSLARAMLRKSKVVILDEATSNLDPETDRHVQNVIREHFKGCTIISVAHRVDTVLDADKVAVFEDGRLVEFDDPQKLLISESKFKRLYSAS